MEKLHIVVDKLPSPSLISEFAPISIAVIALIVSIISILATRAAHIKSVRPFLWTMNFASLDAQSNVVNHPNTVMILVRNSPAKVTSEKHELFRVENEQTESVYCSDDKSIIIRYPEERSQYTYTIPDFEDILNNTGNNVELIRKIIISYKSLSNGKTYSYTNESKYDTTENVWKEILVTAS